jgi:hypothetical protein
MARNALTARHRWKLAEQWAAPPAEATPNLRASYHDTVRNFNADGLLALRAHAWRTLSIQDAYTIPTHRVRVIAIGSPRPWRRISRRRRRITHKNRTAADWARPACPQSEKTPSSGDVYCGPWTVGDEASVRCSPAASCPSGIVGTNRNAQLAHSHKRCDRSHSRILNGSTVRTMFRIEVRSL